MADVNNGEQPTIPTKRCSDISSQDPSPTPKKQKLNTNSENTDNKTTLEQQEVPLLLEEQNKQTPQEEIEESEQLCNQKSTVDRKGKGILIEEDDDDDSDDDDSGSDSDSGDNLSEGEGGDFVDDPLAEVDLDNILPSRTRRRSIQPGAYIATDLPDDDDDSDDPDA